jgi:hypothetical protein
MEIIASIANTLWAASNLSAWRGFRLALQNPQATQGRHLQNLLMSNAHTAFGKLHRFDEIRSYEEFARRVPVSTYDDLAPWIARIRRGEQQVLASDRVTHLIPTSGSRGGRKLIPFTASLQREFDAAIGAWILDLFRQHPGLIGGPAYWSITPALKDRADEDSVVPVGFDSDTAYLAGHGQRLAEAIMAVPPEAARAKSLEEFRYNTLLHLLLRRDLRLISVWHPSFLSLLLDALPRHWQRLLTDIGCGTRFTRASHRRADELRSADPLRPTTLWPSLRLISCWGDAAASLAMQTLQRRVPNLHIQSKGLMATEGLVTVPFQAQYPVAVTSHFFEFIDDQGQPHPVESLQEGEEYQVMLTTAGGLWRYRLGDRVRVVGFVARTPSLKFLGRSGKVSDMCGEKLSEQFVCEVMGDVFGSCPPPFALLAPDADDDSCRYTLYVEGEAMTHWAQAIDEGLRRNPHYAYCRDLGQLLPARIFRIAGNAYDAFVQQESSSGARLGDIKPGALSLKPNWSRIFRGGYLLDLKAHSMKAPVRIDYADGNLQGQPLDQGQPLFPDLHRSQR